MDESEHDHEQTAVESRRRQYVGVGLFGTVVGLATAAVAPFLAPALRRHILPYIPATDAQLHSSLKLARAGLAMVQASQGSDRAHRVLRAIDLGSGDGRVVLAVVSELGLSAEGVELNRWLVWWARVAAWRQGLTQRQARFRVADLWTTNLAAYDVIFIFGVREMMHDVERKLQVEAAPHAVIISNRFPLPNWKPIQCDGVGSLYLRPETGSWSQSRTHHHPLASSIRPGLLDAASVGPRKQVNMEHVRFTGDSHPHLDGKREEESVL